MILRDHFQENRTSRRRFLLLRISFPARHIYYTIATREDGRKNYGVAIVFYEEVTDTNICHAVHTLQVRVLGFGNVFYKRCKYLWGTPGRDATAAKTYTKSKTKTRTVVVHTELTKNYLNPPLKELYRVTMMVSD